MASKLVNKAGKAVLATGNLATSAYTDFSKLLKDFNVIGFVLGLLIANGVAEIANSFIDGILMPSVQPILDKISKKGSELLDSYLEYFSLEEFDKEEFSEDYKKYYEKESIRLEKLKNSLL